MNAPAQGAFAEEFVELVLRYAVRSQGFELQNRNMHGVRGGATKCASDSSEKSLLNQLEMVPRLNFCRRGLEYAVYHVNYESANRHWRVDAGSFGSPE